MNFEERVYIQTNKQFPLQQCVSAEYVAHKTLLQTPPLQFPLQQSENAVHVAPKSSQFSLELESS